VLLGISGARSSAAKGSANGTLSAPAAGEYLADAPGAFVGIEHPGPGLPGRLVAQMLGVAAGQLDHPVPLFVEVEAGDPTDGLLLVRAGFAIG